MQMLWMQRNICIAAAAFNISRPLQARPPQAARYSTDDWETDLRISGIKCE